ncbi:multicopper oxidase [Macrolepiota fuliginosa MF-IS2]|nr:multicopper oxidase [Macrolepiota fuliginosa MF-IS2]
MAPGLATPDGADYVFNLNLTFNPETFIFSVDGRSFVPPTVPVLLQIMSGARSAHDLLPDGSIFTVERNKTVQINIPGGLEGGPHPFHLHGHDFSVIKSANSGHFNFLDPIRRDVVSTSTDIGDYVSIRFKTDNPGPWIIHCHIDFHLAWGLAFVFAEAPDETMTWIGNPSDEWSNLCPTWDALPGNVKQSQTHVVPSAAT